MLDRTAHNTTTGAGLIGSDLPIRFTGVDYRVGAVSILCGIDLEITGGPPTLLLGPNGSGKTTLLKLAMGLIRPTAGSITYAGRESPATGTRAFVFQKPMMLRRTVAANVAFALKAAGRRADRLEIARLLAEVGLAGMDDRPARRLSGGEQQRLALARALAKDPDILFLDEPTASLDPAAIKALEDLVRDIAARGIKVVMSTHNLGEARRLAGEIVLLHRGRIVEVADARQFFTQPKTEDAQRFIAGDLLV